MERESGSKDFPIWLLGDSPPSRWKDRLTEPLDPKHPARHNIWTPVIDRIQECVFRDAYLRVDTSRLYVRNALANAEDKPEGKAEDWGDLHRETREFGDLLKAHRPALVFPFGAFAFEFANRSLARDTEKAYGHWGAKGLGEEFRRRVCDFSPDCINILPLLHISISQGRFLESHEYFTAEEEEDNYFYYVGDGIAKLLLQHRDVLQIWAESQQPGL